MNGVLLDYLVKKYGKEFFFVIDLNGNGRVDAYLFAGVEKNKRMHILSIALYEEFDGKGWGTKLLQKLVSKSKEANLTKIDLNVECTNTRAIALYQKFGFKQIDIARNYYGTNRDAYCMTLEI